MDRPSGITARCNAEACGPARLAHIVAIKGVSNTMGSFNGIGTMFHGCSDVRPDGSYVATKWFAIIYLPLVPLRSVRMIEIGRQSTAGGVPGIGIPGIVSYSSS